MQMLWKEWRQQRGMFLLFCLGGISFPVLECYVTWSRSGEIRTDTGSGILLAFGALFAIILAIATTHHDTQKSVDDFWQSRPIRIRRLFAAKVFLAAVLMLVVFLMMISLDMVTHFRRSSNASFAWQAFCHTYPLALMLFALTMFLVVVLRDDAKVVLIAIWATLLVYFLPLLIGGLGWMSIFERLDSLEENSLFSRIWAVSGSSARVETFGQWIQYVFGDYSWRYLLQYLLYLVVMVGGAGVFLVLSVKAMKNRWRWRPGQKTVVWTLGLSAALIFCLSMFHVGYNLVPVTTFQGRQIEPLMSFDTTPENTIDWAGPEADEMSLKLDYTWADSQLCVDGDYIYRVVRVAKSRNWNKPVVQDWFLDIYNHPKIEGTSRHLAKVRFFSAPPAKRNYHQNILADFVRNKRLYVAYQPRLESDDGVKNPLRFLAADVSNPLEPKRLFDEVIYEPKRAGARTKGYRSNFEDYCYVAFGDELVVISVVQDEPKVLNTFSRTELGLNEDSWIPSHGLSVLEDRRIICFDYSQVMLLDIENPAEPKKIFFGRFKSEAAGQRGDEIGAATCDADKLYIGRESGLYVYQVNVDGEAGESKLIGRRRSTPLEKLASHYPIQLLAYQGRLFEAASGLGLLVYDISEPTRPRRAFHGGDGRYISSIGIWEGTLYAGNPHHTVGGYLNFFNIPKAK